MGHPPCVNGPPIRRHVLDPGRRKSSIISRPLEAGVSYSYWTTFSMTTPKPPWRSTDCCPRNARALPGRMPFPGPWHAGTPRNASCTDFRSDNRRKTQRNCPDKGASDDCCHGADLSAAMGEGTRKTTGSAEKPRPHCVHRAEHARQQVVLRHFCRASVLSRNTVAYKCVRRVP